MTHIEKNYYDFHAKHLHEKSLKEKTPSDLLPFLEELKQGSRVLDLGCGNGIDLTWLTKAGHACVGIDSSAEMVAIARAIHSQSGAEIQQKNFLFLSFVESEFDGVWANLSFPHLAPEELQRLLAICFKAVKVGGVLGAVLYEGKGSFEDRANVPAGAQSFEGPSRKIHLYAEKQLCSMFEQTGFQVKKIGRKQDAHDRLSKILILAERI